MRWELLRNPKLLCERLASESQRRLRNIRWELLYNPGLLCEHLAHASETNRRLGKLKNTVARGMNLKQLDSLELLELLKHQPPEVIYDIGANEASWTLLARAIFPSAEIHAFEPLNNHILKFKDNTNQLSNVYLHPIALGPSETKQPIQIATSSSSSSLLEIGPQMEKSFQIRKAREEIVSVETLDDYVSAKKLTPPDLIKLDVQGYELAVLQGGLACLQQTGAVIMEVSFIEYYPKQCLFADVIPFMSSHGFSLHAYSVRTTLGRRVEQTDVLFVRD